MFTLKKKIIPEDSNIETFFTKRLTPDSDWDMIKWLIFEPTLLKRFRENLYRKEDILQFIKIALIFVIPSSFFLLILFNTIIAFFDFPNLYPNIFETEILTQWNLLQNFFDKLWFLFHYDLFNLSFNLRGTFEGVLISGLTSGLCFSLFENMKDNLILCLIASIVFSLISGFMFGLIGGLICFLAYNIGFIFSYSRVWLYPLYFVKTNISKATFIQNPYLYDENIWMPLPLLKKQLLAQASQKPDIAMFFAAFLLRYRKFQQSLAFEIIHKARSSRWKTILKLEAHILNDTVAFETQSNNISKFMTSIVWGKKLEELYQTLVALEVNTALVLRQESLERCQNIVTEFSTLHQYETFEGREYYYSVFEHWARVLRNQRQELEAEINRVQTVSSNPYSKGDALEPNRLNAALFLERTDVKDLISLKILTSESMPTFLILGQRRVGKTSLLNFMPPLLGARFDIVSMDLQSLSGSTTPVGWLVALRQRIVDKLALKANHWQAPTDWLEAWTSFEIFLKTILYKGDRKLLLAFDEYEYLHKILHSQPELGGNFLGRMRAFSQGQNRIIFLFIGATHFSDLTQPQWSRYFVHAQIFRVDYLSEKATLQLVTQPIPDFRLKYGEGVAKQIWELTQGHPHLIHAICSDLVDYANSKGKNPIQITDLDFVLSHQIVLKAEQPFSVFWDEFCETTSMQSVVKKIAFGQNVNIQSRDVKRLEEYGFIVKQASGQFKMRVPLFERWVQNFGY